LNAAFADPGVAIIQCALGGLLGNQVLPFLDFGLIRRQPKWLVGHSDNTALINAIVSTAGVAAIYGPHFLDLGRSDSGAMATRILEASGGSWTLSSAFSSAWSDEPWWDSGEINQWHTDPPLVVLRPGEARGPVVGGNLGTYALLADTPNRPTLDGAILILDEVSIGERNFLGVILRRVAQVAQWPDFEGVAGIIVARFPNTPSIDPAVIGRELVAATPPSVPIVLNAPLGHTVPLLAMPLGQPLRLTALSSGSVRVHCPAPGAGPAPPD
jgi:muramoyltetrapeptide carboxypeptidase LdcA involved in peptidoglycan recycling